MVEVEADLLPAPQLAAWLALDGPIPTVESWAHDFQLFDWFLVVVVLVFFSYRLVSVIKYFFAFQCRCRLFSQFCYLQE